MKGRNFNFLITGLLCFMTVMLRGHESGSTEHHLEGPKSGITGSVELRPSWEADSGNFFGENIVEIGYRFHDKFQLSYEQEIHHNIALSEPNPEHEGLGLHLETGLLKAHIHEVWESEDGLSSLSLEPRSHMPTSAEDRAKGFLTAGLSYIKYRRQLGNSVALTVMDAPVLFLYSAPGATAGEEFAANPIFQNRFRVAFDVALFDGKVSLTLPFLFCLTRHADYDFEADHNNSWTTFLGIAPEIGYQFSPNFTVGLTVVTPNLLDNQIPDHSVNHGRTSTVSQLILRAQL